MFTSPGDSAFEVKEGQWQQEGSGGEVAGSAEGRERQGAVKGLRERTPGKRGLGTLDGPSPPSVQGSGRRDRGQIWESNSLPAALRSLWKYREK